MARISSKDSFTSTDIRQTGYDNWDGGINYYTIYFEVNISKFIEIRNDLNQWEQILLENFSLPVRHLEGGDITRVTIAPKSKLVITRNQSAPASFQRFRSNEKHNWSTISTGYLKMN